MVYDEEKKEFKRYWKAQGAGVFLHTVVNRAGTLKNFHNMESHEPRLVKRLILHTLNLIFPFCPLPFCSLAVLWDGRVILCCHDWKPSIVVGDLKSNPYKIFGMVTS